MTPQPTSSGFWTIYMDNLDMTPVMSSPAPSDVSSNLPQVTALEALISAVCCGFTHMLRIVLPGVTICCPC